MKYLKVAMPWGEVSVEFENGVIYKASLGGEVSPESEPGSWPSLEAKLKKYALGQPVEFDEPLALTNTGFYQKVWLYLQKECKWGTVMTYQQVAKAVGSPKAARAVGNAMRLNTIPLIVP